VNDKIIEYVLLFITAIAAISLLTRTIITGEDIPSGGKEYRYAGIIYYEVGGCDKTSSSLHHRSDRPPWTELAS